LVSGGTQSGKTTLLNALTGAIPLTERLVTIEEVFELNPQLPDVVQMQTRSANLQGDGEIPLRRLIKEALRMRPSRIVVGEVREAEALDLLIALNSGLPGMGTLHANSPRDAITKLQTLPLLAGENISHKFIAPTVASAIDLIVHVSLDSTGMRRVQEICALTGRYENDRRNTKLVWALSHTQKSLPRLVLPLLRGGTSERLTKTHYHFNCFILFNVLICIPPYSFHNYCKRFCNSWWSYYLVNPSKQRSEE
jgi:pilus assembly protein CpaF